MSNRRVLVAACMVIFIALVCFAGTSVEAASPWYYSVTGPGGSNEIPADKIGQILYFQFDATTADYVWGNIRIDFDTTLLECVSIEETSDPNGFWTAWVSTTAEHAYGGGGELYYYDSTGLGSDWAQYWVGQYGPLGAGPSGSYDNTLGIIRLYVMTSAGGRDGSVPLRLGFRVKQAGTAVFNTYANDWTAFGWPAAASSVSAASSIQASSGQGFSWNLADLPFRYTSVVKIVPQTCVQPPSGMVGWWPGDGNANDLVHGNNGTLIGGVTFAPGTVGQAFNLDGIDDYINLGNEPDFQVSKGDFTVDAWVKLNALRAGDMSIVDKIANWGEDNADGWRLIKQNDGHFWFCFGGGQNACYVGSPLTVRSVSISQIGIWYHIAGVKSSSGISIYVNGVLEDFRPYYPFYDTNSADLLIGGNAQYGAHFNGLVDEVEIFNRALIADEIRAIYLAGSAGKCKNSPPVANAGPDQTVEMTSCAGASVILDGSASSDPDGDSLTYTWKENGTVIATGVNPTVTLSYGSHTIFLTVDDGKGGTASDTVVINVVDTTAPVLNVTLNPNSFWPPNHKYVTVTPSITVNDACVATTSVAMISATSSEPDNGLGDGDTANDIVINASGTISLRAERSGTGPGRVYSITYQATDIAGNSTTASATVTVPHNK